MKNDEEVFENFLVNLSVIILRKVDFFNIFMKELATKVGEDEVNRIAPRVEDILAKMDPFLFMSKEELKTGNLLTSTQLVDLDRRKIGYEISRLLGF